MFVFIGKQVTMSSMMSSLIADQPHYFKGSFAVDGIYEEGAAVGAMVVSLVEVSPWIQVDLGDSYCIEGIQIWYPFQSYGK